MNMIKVSKTILFLAVLLLVLPVCFGASFNKIIPSHIEEPDVINVSIIINTEGYNEFDLLELVPSGTEILNWNASTLAELESRTKDFDYFGKVEVYRWNFKEVNQEEIILDYQIEVKEYGNFETTTLIIYEDGFSSESHNVYVGETVQTGLIFTELEEPIWQLAVLMLATIILVSGVYYRYFKNKEKESKEKNKKSKKKKNTKKTKN